MKRFVIIMCAVMAAAAVFAGNKVPKGWVTDIDSAMKTAKAEKKNILLLFTGSDWCPACSMLKKKILDKNDFKRYAKDNLILVYFDFPRNHRIERNQYFNQFQWQKKLDIPGYPTTIIMDHTGRELERIVGVDPDYMEKIAVKAGKKSVRGKGKK